MAVRNSMMLAKTGAAALHGMSGWGQQHGRVAPSVNPVPPRSSLSQVATSAGLGGPLRGANQNVGGASPVSPQTTSQDSTGGGGGTDPTAPPPNLIGGYDLSTDPVLQQVQAQITNANQAAQSGALNQEQQALLAYGDPALAASVLGSTDPTVQAARQNQESTLAQLARGHTQGLTTFENTLDPSLVYSGARIKQTGLIDQAYQDELSRAATGIQGTLSGIQGGLQSTLGQNTTTLDNAIADAYTRAVAAAEANPPMPTVPSAAGLAANMTPALHAGILGLAGRASPAQSHAIHAYTHSNSGTALRRALTRAAAGG